MWAEEWRRISARIAALIAAGEFFLRSGVTLGDQDCGSNLLVANANGTAEAVRRLADGHCGRLTGEQRRCLAAFQERYSEVGSPPGLAGVMSRVAYLASLRAEFDYLSSDTAEQVRRLTARAFTHLQRLIVADPDVRRRWKAAFDAGETECEKLGACHLLWHGIWAFKCGAAGERTDLVMAEQRFDEQLARCSAQGMVLTEWKLAKGGDTAREGAEGGARRQAERYHGGILAGLEISSPRYLVIVSEGSLAPPKRDGAYEYIYLAVDPTTPSRAARRA